MNNEKFVEKKKERKKEKVKLSRMNTEIQLVN